MARLIQRLGSLFKADLMLQVIKAIVGLAATEKVPSSSRKMCKDLILGLQGITYFLFLAKASLFRTFLKSQMLTLGF